jgi:hypothetical protein
MAINSILLVFYKNWITITGVLIVNFGLAISMLGAIKISRADFPRNDWILEALYSSANSPSYGVISPAGYNPQAERADKIQKVQEIRKQTERLKGVCP